MNERCYRKYQTLSKSAKSLSLFCQDFMLAIPVLSHRTTTHIYSLLIVLISCWKRITIVPASQPIGDGFNPRGVTLTYDLVVLTVSFSKIVFDKNSSGVNMRKTGKNICVRYEKTGMKKWSDSVLSDL